MSSGYKSNKINENALSKCQKCDCIILSDSSDPENPRCFKPCPNKKQKTPRPISEPETDTTNSTPNSKCQSTVKIVVKGNCPACDGGKNSSSDDKDLNPEVSMKHICFRFCRKKGNKSDDKKKPKGKEGDQKKDENENKEQAGNQTSRVDVNDTKTQMSESQIKEQPVKDCTCLKPPQGQYCTCKPGTGGCNTNTIIFPRDNFCADSTCIEKIIRNEIRSSNRNLEEILNELTKQRREVHELKESLDIMARGMREHLFMMCFNKCKNGYVDPYEDIRKNSLERKSNTMSITKSNSGDNKNPNLINKKEDSKNSNQPDKVETQNQNKKKKGIFSWCK